MMMYHVPDWFENDTFAFEAAWFSLFSFACGSAIGQCASIVASYHAEKQRTWSGLSIAGLVTVITTASLFVLVYRPWDSEAKIFSKAFGASITGIAAGIGCLNCWVISSCRWKTQRLLFSQTRKWLENDVASFAIEREGCNWQSSPSDGNSQGMRSLNRRAAVLEEIEKLWRLHPDWRLGQLVCNVAAWSDPTHNMVWDMDDDILVAEIQRHMAQQESVVAGPK